MAAGPGGSAGGCRDRRARGRRRPTACRSRTGIPGSQRSSSIAASVPGAGPRAPVRSRVVASASGSSTARSQVGQYQRVSSGVPHRPWRIGSWSVGRAGRPSRRAAAAPRRGRGRRRSARTTSAAAAPGTGVATTIRSRSRRRSRSVRMFGAIPATLSPSSLNRRGSAEQRLDQEQAPAVADALERGFERRRLALWRRAQAWLRW